MLCRKMVLPLALAVAVAISANPADAQGRDNGKSNPHVERRDRDRDDDRYDGRRDRDDDRRSRTRSRNDSRFERRVPPGWCIGRGNPRNTVENCGPGSGRYDPRYRTGRYGRNGTDGNHGSYAEWKRRHDARCRDLSRQRPLDLRWQLQVRQQCTAEEREARDRYGV